MSDKAVLFAVSLLVIMAVSVLIAVWRLRKHATQKAEAERRMGAALEEIHRLTARLREEKSKRDGDHASDSTKSGESGSPKVGESVTGRKKV